MQNIYTILGTLIILCASLITKAQESTLANSILWKIEGNDIKEPSYLMGTIHLLCEEDFEMKEKIVQAIEKTEEITLEVDFADPSEMAAMSSSLMGDGKLSEKLTETQAASLNRILESKLNAGLESYDQLSLLAIYSIILNQSITCASKKMWEMELIGIAKDLDKEVNGLELISGQSDYFTKAFPAEKLIEQLEIMDEYSSEFDHMVDAYKNENIEEIGKMISDPRFMDDNAEYWMLEYRNTNWLNTMPEMMKEKSQFFAVGSAHLVGEHGIIKGLKEKGYTVTPVFN